MSTAAGHASRLAVIGPNCQSIHQSQSSRLKLRQHAIVAASIDTDSQPQGNLDISYMPRTIHCSINSGSFRAICPNICRSCIVIYLTSAIVSVFHERSRTRGCSPPTGSRLNIVPSSKSPSPSKAAPPSLNARISTTRAGRYLCSRSVSHANIPCFLGSRRATVLNASLTCSSGTLAVPVSILAADRAPKRCGDVAFPALDDPAPYPR